MVFFCASAIAHPARQINIGSGNNQKVETGAQIAEPLRVWVSDGLNPSPGIPVSFRVIEGGGQLIPGGRDGTVDPQFPDSQSSTDLVVLSGYTGHASVGFIAGPYGGDNVIEATFPGQFGLPARFMVYGVVRDPDKPGSFTGLILDNTSRPIGHAYCELQVAHFKKGTFSDPQGRFRFDEVPGGMGHLHVQGFTATSLFTNGIPTNSFPAISYAVVTVANAENSLPWPVLLPRLNPVNAVSYSGTNDIVVTCAGIEGLKMTIQANSMRHPDGVRVTPDRPAYVSLNQVNHEDVPMPMPDGVAPPFAWTLQPSGATFDVDKPVRVEYPNMSGLAPGSIAYFLSFNHDTERFEIVSSGHVSEDGSTILTDPNSGLTLAGWGCNCPPYSVTGDCEKCKQPENGGPDPKDLRLAIAFDGDGDGQIRFDGSDATPASRPIQFWVNEDDDSNAPPVGELASRFIDSSDQMITGERDLEDFLQFAISFVGPVRELLGCGYHLELVGTENIRVFKSAGRGATSHLHPGGSMDQYRGTFAVGRATLEYRNQINPSRLSNYFTSADFARGEAAFLLEGKKPGQSLLKVQLRKSKGSGSRTNITSGSAAIHLLPIRQMFEQYRDENSPSGQNVDAFFPLEPSVVVTGIPTLLNSFERRLSRIDDANNTLVFVHGWNMPEFYKSNFAETMFKRLHWAGFRGQFISYRWPCLLQPAGLSGFLESSFNQSEFIAFKHGRTLANLVNSLSGRVHVAAHSQGNIVASEALMMGSAISTYVMMQAAVPAMAYDPLKAQSMLAPDLLAAELISPTYEPTSFSQLDRGYYGYFEGIGGAAGKIVNFYNRNDLALAAWGANQIGAKPSTYQPASPWFYDFEAGDPVGDRQALWQRNPVPLSIPLYLRGRLVSSVHEVMAFMARSVTLAVGAEGRTAGAVTHSFDLAASLGLRASRSDHSAQFNRNIQALWPFYRQLLVECGISPIAAPSPSSPGKHSDLPVEDELEGIDQDWHLASGGQTAVGETFGYFHIGNITAPDQFADFVSDDPVRVTGVSTMGGTNRYVSSKYFHVRQGETTFIDDLNFSDTPPRQAERLEILTTSRTLSVGTTNQLHVIAHYADGTTNDVSHETAWTSYRVSNTNIATINSNGALTPRMAGIVFVTAQNDANTAVLGLNLTVPESPFTTVIGRVIAPDGSFAEGVVVSLSPVQGFETVTGPDGAFTIPNVPVGLRRILLIGQRISNGVAYLVSKKFDLNSGESIDLGNLQFTEFTTRPSQRLASRSAHTLGIRHDGSLWAWGEGGSGQLGHGKFSKEVSPFQVASNWLWKAVAAGNSHSLGIRSDGSLWAWGVNQSGQLGSGIRNSAFVPTPVDTNGIWISISAGISHSLGLKADGSLWVWGGNLSRELGDETTVARPKPTRFSIDGPWLAVSAGADSSVAVRFDGTLWVWGGFFSPRQILTSGEWLDAKVGYRRSVVALRGDGTLWSWDPNRQGTQIGTQTNWTSISRSDGHTVATDDEGNLWAWGNNEFGQLGDGTFENQTEPVLVRAGASWLTAVASSQHTLALRTDGVLYAWGKSEGGYLGDGTDGWIAEPFQVEPGTRWKSVTAGNRHTAGVQVDGTIWAWGDNSQGQLGLKLPGGSGPMSMQSSGNWSDILVSGGRQTLALTTDGQLWSWGRGWYYTGEKYDPRNAPSQISPGLTWRNVSVGRSHQAAIREDNTLWTWGASFAGALGQPQTPENEGSPSQLGSSLWSAVSTGDDYTLAIRLDGTLWAWGNNSEGQLGDGSQQSRQSPTQIGEDTDWVAVAAGKAHSLGVKADRSLWAWGRNRDGELGLETGDNRRREPSQVTTWSWNAISAGNNYSLAVREDGTLWAWGINQYGQLGNGIPSMFGVRAPVQIGTESSWLKVVAGSDHSAALRKDGTLWTWGRNEFGKLGIKMVPVLGGAVWGPPKP